MADVYVKAVQLRKLDQADGSSRFDPAEQTGPPEKFNDPAEGAAVAANSRYIIVRARVLPREKERKPFLIQRCFNLDEMRASASISKAGAKSELRCLPSHEGGGELEDAGTQDHPERPKSDPSAKPFKMRAQSKPHSSSCDRIAAVNFSRTSGRRIMAMPIREYFPHNLVSYSPIYCLLTNSSSDVEFAYITYQSW